MSFFSAAICLTGVLFVAAGWVGIFGAAWRGEESPLSLMAWGVVMFVVAALAHLIIIKGFPE